MILDQEIVNAGFALRRYVIVPMPAKPRIIIVQVEGTGTALALVVNSSPLGALSPGSPRSLKNMNS
jgi:hypothetical protein